MDKNLKSGTAIMLNNYPSIRDVFKEMQSVQSEKNTLGTARLARHKALVERWERVFNDNPKKVF